MSHADPLTCGREKRRDAVRASQDLNGLDYLEVSDEVFARVREMYAALESEGRGAVARRARAHS